MCAEIAADDSYFSTLKLNYLYSKFAIPHFEITNFSTGVTQLWNLYCEIAKQTPNRYLLKIKCAIFQNYVELTM